jgi:hypothetical protein
MHIFSLGHLPVEEGDVQGECMSATPNSLLLPEGHILWESKLLSQPSHLVSHSCYGSAQQHAVYDTVNG